MDSGHLTSPQPIRVLLVDDHPAVRQGLALLLAPEGIEVCAEAGGRADAMARVEECRPDLAIVDLSLDGGAGRRPAHFRRQSTQFGAPKRWYGGLLGR
jgi:DNA-binding NarL/FixJ family response regulator